MPSVITLFFEWLMLHSIDLSSEWVCFFEEKKCWNMLYNTSKNFVFRGVLSYRELRGRHEMLSTIGGADGGKLFTTCTAK